jgi:predicted component of type VI protein secretion system
VDPATQQADAVQTPAVSVTAGDSGRLSFDVLQYENAERQQVNLPLDPARMRWVIGRSAGCDVSIGWDNTVSRAHAILERVGEDWLIVDGGLSRNGTFVNGERLVGGQRLRHDDRILLGATVLRFRAGIPAHTSTTRVGCPAPELSPGQKRVLQALCRPLAADPDALAASNREIAAEVHLTEETVKDYMSQLFVRFRIPGVGRGKRERLAREARRAGLG